MEKMTFVYQGEGMAFPMASSIKSILNGVAVIAVVFWLLNVFGMLGSLSKITMGK